MNYCFKVFLFKKKLFLSRYSGLPRLSLFKFWQESLLIFYFDHLFSQEYILKGVVNAALGQEIGSVSISFERSVTRRQICWQVSPGQMLVIVLLSLRGITWKLLSSSFSWSEARLANAVRWIEVGSIWSSKATLCEHLCIIYFFLIDTIPGRQCMASCFFLLRQFEDVLIYLNSVKVSLAQYKAHIMWYIPVRNHSDMTLL